MASGKLITVSQLARLKKMRIKITLSIELQMAWALMDAAQVSSMEQQNKVSLS